MSAAAQDRLLSLRDVLRVLGCDLGSLGRLQRILGSLPAAQRQADGCLRWRLADVEEWAVREYPGTSRFPGGTARSHGAGASAEGGGDDAGMPE